jgi:DNA-binding HxlR family transcriptional regulator
MKENIRDIHCGDSNCPVKKTADIVAKKWATLIVRDLLDGKKSFSQLERGLHGISPKVLADRLKLLENKNIISRKVFPTNPPTTQYSLTPLGGKLRNVILAMAEFGERI